MMTDSVGMASTDQSACAWLLEKADAPIRYRVAIELLRDERMAQEIEPALSLHPQVTAWLKWLKPQTPPQHAMMEHGSFHTNLENALLKLHRLGLRGDSPSVVDALSYYFDRMDAAYADALSVSPSDGARCRRWDLFHAIIAANIFAAAGVRHATSEAFLTGSLDEVSAFAARGDYRLYLQDDRRALLKGLPACWRDADILDPALTAARGVCYPLVYDIVGLSAVYGRDAATDAKIDAVLRYIATDAFHKTVSDGYGVLCGGKNRYWSMGWDPKFPGWLDVVGCLAGGGASKLLCFAERVAAFPLARQTKWFQELRAQLEAHRTPRGTYLFPADWLRETTGYAVVGCHMDYGENRRKPDWREIESTFYMALLHRHDE